MLVANFNLSSNQMQILVAFRHNPETHGGDNHPIEKIDTSVPALRKMCREGYLEWLPARDEGKQRIPPGYRLTSKGEMMLRIIEAELRRTLAWFDGTPLPRSNQTGAQHDYATGKAEETKTGGYRRKKRAS